MTRHHIYGRQNSNRTIDLCVDCHVELHRAFSNEELERGACTTVEQMREAVLKDRGPRRT